MSNAPSKGSSNPTDTGISLALTERQKESLQALNKPIATDHGDHEEKHLVKIEGRLKDGQLIVDNMSIEFMHRWMDCEQKPKNTLG